eukprot:TRINITY_DN993_c0_g1_i5.p1 TRINITY_DN993_c0_g1~~TRINITY_DN993_c0_g1_i5.p1  ORF type:complete len:259 (+),score=42.43 TRINITY_DN993_c0_g1_i5:431-1207(+)
MSSGALRRRIHHEDVGGKKFERIDSTGSDASNEPLLGRDQIDDASSSLDFDEYDWKEKKRKEEQAWTQIFSRLLVQWAQLFTHVVMGSGAWVGNMVFRVLRRQNSLESRLVPDMTPEQEVRLRKLQQRLGVPFDGTRSDHQEALRTLWEVAYPNRDLQGLVSEQWKDMGWQGTDPSTDFRGGGFVSLENLLFFAGRFPGSFQRLLNKEEGKRATWEYPFAVAGLNISFMLIQMLDLRSPRPSSWSAGTFLKILTGVTT